MRRILLFGLIVVLSACGALPIGQSGPPPPTPAPLASYGTVVEYTLSFSGVFEGSVRGVALARRLNTGARAFHFSGGSGYRFILTLPPGLTPMSADLLTDETQTGAGFVGVLMTAAAAEPDFTTAPTGRVSIVALNLMAGSAEFTAKNAAGQSLTAQVAFTELPTASYMLNVTGGITQSMPPGEPIFTHPDGEYHVMFMDAVYSHPRLAEPVGVQGVNPTLILSESVRPGLVILDGTTNRVEIPNYTPGAGGNLNINSIGETFTGSFAFGATASDGSVGITVQGNVANAPLITDLPF